MMTEEVQRTNTNSGYVDDERPVYTCPYCSKEFTDASSWSLHKQLHTSTQVFRCQLCAYTCRIKKYLARHMKYHRPPTEYSCPVCGKGFYFRCKMESHMRVHTKEKPFVCTVCEKAFSSSYSLSGHMLTHTDEKPFPCSFCDYACRDSSTLRKHMERHIGTSKSYECQICNKNYKCKWQLKSHLEEKHFGLEPTRYPCQLCDKQFKTKYNVDKHIKAVHERSLSCECGVCGHVISNKSNLAQHMKRHVDVAPYKCTFADCHRRFKDKGDLRKHAIIHYPEKQHPCGICGRLFARRRRLARHMAAHAARTRAVECHHCGVLFYSKNYLLLHIKKKHDRKRKKFICDLCAFTTSNKPSLVMHLKYGHSGRRDRKCQICNKEYKKHEYLKMHYLKTHNIRFKTLLKETDKNPIESEEEQNEEESIEYHPEIDLLEIHKEELVEPEYSDPITYSETVLTEDISHSIMQRDKRTRGVPENEFDSFFIDHVIENPDNSAVKFDKYNVKGRGINSRDISVEIDVEKLDKSDMELEVNSREGSVEIDVEKFDKFDMEGLTSLEESDDIDEDPVILDERSGERILNDFVKPVKIFVEKLDNKIIGKAVKMNKMEAKVEKIDNSIDKTVKISVEKLDIDGLRKNCVSKPKKYVTKHNIVMKNNRLQVCVEKLDVNRLNKRKIDMKKLNKNLKNICVKDSDRSYVVKIDKNNLGRRSSMRRGRKRGGKLVKNINMNTKENIESTPEPDISDYSKSVLSEDISRCLQERTGRAPGEPENRLESIFIDHYMEKTDDTPLSEYESDSTAYSRRVLSEDVSRSVMRRDARAAGDPQADIDRLFIDHLMEKPDKHAVELEKKNIDTQKERYVKKCVNKMLQQIRAQKEAAILEEARQKYNERINELSTKADKKEHVNIRYFQNKLSEAGNNNDEPSDDQIVENDDTNDGPTDDQTAENDNIGTTNDENSGSIDDQTAENNNNTTNDEIDTANNDNSVSIDDQTAENNNNTTNDEIDTANNDNSGSIDDQTAENNNNTTNDEIDTANNDNSGSIDDQMIENDIDSTNNDTIDTRDDKNDDESNIDEGIQKKNNKINFNTHQCYICFELFKTKLELTHHCKKHFQICSQKMLKKCPYCGYVTDLHMKRHLQLKHDIKLDFFNTQITEINNETGPKYYLKTEKCTLEVIPSINNLNKQASMKLDEANRANKNNEISMAKLVKKGSEWVVDKDILKITNDYQLPEFSIEEYLSLNIAGEKYLDMLKKLSFLAKKRGTKMLFPCNECNKVCRKMSGLVLHNRIHEDNPKPFKRKVWKDRDVKTKNINKHVRNNTVKVINKVRNSDIYKEFTENQIKRKQFRHIANKTTNLDITNTNNVASEENASANSRKLGNRFAEPKPIVNKHKCEKRLMEFYNNNIKGGDIEFWQFLKIFNKMSRENVNNFEELESRTDFGIHNKDTTAGNTESKGEHSDGNTSNITLTNIEDGNTNSEIGNIGPINMSVEEDELRKRIEENII